jgi:hypothetical protein
VQFSGAHHALETDLRLRWGTLQRIGFFTLVKEICFDRDQNYMLTAGMSAGIVRLLALDYPLTTGAAAQ